ncbi:hypothetical protein XENOCAPTIV_002280 [Xenoophorus captivus]|uniref:Uncharacterized protein n=1 Tax=Xenoophorus captivus TaxID=1517983 RepID=A0ABV0S2K4_9TELE
MNLLTLEGGNYRELSVSGSNILPANVLSAIRVDVLQIAKYSESGPIIKITTISTEYIKSAVFIGKLFLQEPHSFPFCPTNKKKSELRISLVTEKKKRIC